MSLLPNPDDSCVGPGGQTGTTGRVVSSLLPSPSGLSSDISMSTFIVCNPDMCGGGGLGLFITLHKFCVFTYSLT